jgi:hypothetical protein
MIVGPNPERSIQETVTWPVAWSVEVNACSVTVRVEAGMYGQAYGPELRMPTNLNYYADGKGLLRYPDGLKTTGRGSI